MKKIDNKNFSLNLLIISFVSILLVYLFVTFKLSQDETTLFIIRFSTMLLTALMILTFIIFAIIFLIRLIFKKKDCYGRCLIILGVITLILALSTVIMIKEQNRYYHILNMNWKLNLPRQYEEIYYKDSGESFHGDGERYSVFQYNTLEEINNAIELNSKNDNIEPSVTKILEKLKVSKDYYPDFNNDYKYYYKIKEDTSQLYIILDSNLKKAYIVENIF